MRDSLLSKSTQGNFNGGTPTKEYESYAHLYVLVKHLNCCFGDILHGRVVSSERAFGYAARLPYANCKLSCFRRGWDCSLDL